MQPYQWIDQFTGLGAYWKHSGNPADPHVILTSGIHSDGYLNCTRVVQRTDVLDRVAQILAERIKWTCPAQWVFGSPMGSITLAQRIAHYLPACHRAGFTEPDGERLKVSRFELEPGAVALVVDDVLTTGGTTEKTIAALETAGAKVLDQLLVIANRSGQPTFKGREIISLINLPLVKWEPSECPLCAQGSEALDMSGKGNWALLTGKA